MLSSDIWNINYDEAYDVSYSLTEAKLIDYLNIIFPDITDWIRDKKLGPYRPDYFSAELSMIVEYNGPKHYTSSKTILRDKKKKEFYEACGIKFIEIPYFVEMDECSIKALFDVYVPWTREYPHGFISKLPTYVLPADYCYLGQLRFKQDIERFSGAVSKEIIESLKIRVDREEVDSVLPGCITIASLESLNNYMQPTADQHTNDSWKIIYKDNLEQLNDLLKTKQIIPYCNGYSWQVNMQVLTHLKQIGLFEDSCIAMHGYNKGFTADNLINFFNSYPQFKLIIDLGIQVAQTEWKPRIYPKYVLIDECKKEDFNLPGGIGATTPDWPDSYTKFPIKDMFYIFD